MRIQPRNVFYTGSYAVLRNTKGGASFPYSVKAEGFGRFGEGKSLFGFATVTITEHMVTEKYGTKITNGPRVQMKTAGCKEPEDFEKVSEEKLAEVKLPASFDLYGQGILSERQNTYDLSLLGLMFGKDAEEMRSLLNKCTENGNYLELLELYNAEGAHSLQRLREKQLKNGGIV